VERTKLFVIGDSISIGYGSYLAKFLGSGFDYSRKGDEGEDLGVSDISEEVKGPNGGDSSVVRRYVEVLEKKGGFHRDIMLLNCGLHDIKVLPGSEERQVSLDEYQKNLDRILSNVQSIAARTVWVRTTPVVSAIHNARKGFFRFEEDVRAYNQAADEIMRAAGIILADLYTFTANHGLDENSVTDGVHFTPEMQMKQASFLAGFIDALLPAGKHRTF
jgi:lysophospholipase L1-like esterase